jgi:hypothetical protein
MANLNWSLLNWQIDVWQDKHRFKVIAAGRRTGKSNLSIKKIIAAGLEAPAGSAVLYVGPTQSQVRQIAWDANYIYVCIATNSWKRTPITTW